MTPIEFFFGILIFFAVIIITAVLFGGWLLLSLVRFLAHGLFALMGWDEASARPGAMRSMTHARCPRGGCRASNPGTARFCRRCGSELPGVQRVQVRRAALW